MASKGEKVREKLKDKGNSLKRSFKNPQTIQDDEEPEEKVEIESTETKIPVLEREVSEVKKVLKETIDDMIERGEKLSELHERTDTLAERSREFKTNTEKVRRKTYCENKKLQIILGVIVFVIIAIVIGVVVAVALKHN